MASGIPPGIREGPEGREEGDLQGCLLLPFPPCGLFQALPLFDESSGQGPSKGGFLPLHQQEPLFSSRMIRSTVGSGFLYSIPTSPSLRGNGTPSPGGCGGPGRPASSEGTRPSPTFSSLRIAVDLHPGRSPGQKDQKGLGVREIRPQGKACPQGAEGEVEPRARRPGRRGGGFPASEGGKAPTSRSLRQKFRGRFSQKRGGRER